MGEAFLTLAAAQQQVKAAQADVDRRQILANSVHVLVQQELRPGADASRADAELAAAKIQLIRSQEIEREASATFAEMLGAAGNQVKIDASSLLGKPPMPYVSKSPLAAHPVAQVGTAALFEVRAREKVLSQSYYPRFNLQGALSGRGSGANPDGSFGTGTDGLGLERRNWAVGLTATFSGWGVSSVPSASGGRVAVAVAAALDSGVVGAERPEFLGSLAHAAATTAESSTIR